MALLVTQTAAPEIDQTFPFCLAPEVSSTKLIEAVASLPANDRLMLSLFYVEGLNLAEVALVLDMTATDVLTQHTVAMAMLRGMTKPR